MSNNELETDSLLDWDPVRSKPITFEVGLIEKGQKKFEDFIPQEVQDTITKMYENNPSIRQESSDEPWIQTFTGKKFFPLNPRSQDICIEDIAHALSMLCRFTGHVSRFYSVAEHSILVSYFCDTKDAFYGLMHDASEYALQDLPSPLKRSGKFEEYKKYEKQLQNLIYNKFGLSDKEPASVKQADMQLLATESVELMSPRHPDWKSKQEPLPIKIIGMSPAEAEKQFLKRFNELY